MSDDKKWQQVLNKLEKAYPDSFKGAKAIAQDDGKLTIYLPVSANPEWLENRMAHIVNPLIKKVYGDIEFKYGWLSQIPTEQATGEKKSTIEDTVRVISKKKKQPFFMVENILFRDGHAAKMKLSGLAVYLCLVMHADNNNECWPSYNTIAKLCGQSRRSVITTTKRLKELEYIDIEHSHKENGDFASNTITILDF